MFFVVLMISCFSHFGANHKGNPEIGLYSQHLAECKKYDEKLMYSRFFTDCEDVNRMIMWETETEEKYNFAQREEVSVDYFSRKSQEREMFYNLLPTAEKTNFKRTKYEDFQDCVGGSEFYSESEEPTRVLKYESENESENESDFQLLEPPKVVKDGGVSWSNYKKKWKVERSIGAERVTGGYFSSLEEAKRKSDDLVYRHEAEIGRESKHTLNFPRSERAPRTFGVFWNKLARKWQVQRKFDNKKVNGGNFTDLEKAKRKADDLVYEYEAKFKKESKLKLNFPRRPEKRSHDINASKVLKRKRFERESTQSSGSADK